MATASFTTPGTPLTMAALKTFLDAALGELLNRHRGASAPDSPVEGQLWWDTSGDPVDTLKRYTVAAGWKSLLTVNKTTGAVTIQSLTLTAAATGFAIAGGTTSKTLTLDTDVTATNLMLKTGSNLAIGSDADGDMYYRASSILARLAKGTANYKMFMNAAGTAPEWASGVTVLASSRDNTSESGDVSYTGVGFKPSAIILFAQIDGGILSSWGMWQGSMSNDRCSSLIYTNASAGKANIAWIQSGASDYQAADMKSADADGCTLTWTKGGSPGVGTINLFFMYIR